MSIGYALRLAIIAGAIALAAAPLGAELRDLLDLLAQAMGQSQCRGLGSFDC